MQFATQAALQVRAARLVVKLGIRDSLRDKSDKSTELLDPAFQLPMQYLHNLSEKIYVTLLLGCAVFVPDVRSENGLACALVSVRPGANAPY